MRCIWVFVLLLALQAFAADDSGKFDRWHYKDLSAKINPLFSEFKYFNFQDQGLSAAITYSVISPTLYRTLVINAFFHEAGRFKSVKLTYPLKCIEPSKQDLSTKLCEDGAIEVLGWGPAEAKIRIRQSSGPVRWDLVFIAPMKQVTTEVTHIPLDGKGPLGWHMNWSPVLRSGLVEGTVRFVDEGKVFSVKTETSYHDQNWEIWYPKTQPFNWLHFTALDSKAERADLLLVEFPRNSSTAAGLTLYSDGKKRFWPQGSYRLALEGRGFIPVTRHLAKNSVQAARGGRDFRMGEHEIPLRYRIKTNDGQLDAVFEVMAAISTSSSKAGTSEEFLLDEQLVRSRVRFVSPAGDVREAQGPGEIMRTLTGPYIAR